VCGGGKGAGFGRVLWAVWSRVFWYLGSDEANPLPAQACVSAFCTKGLKKGKKKKT